MCGFILISFFGKVSRCFSYFHLLLVLEELLTVPLRFRPLRTAPILPTGLEMVSAIKAVASSSLSALVLLETLSVVFVVVVVVEVVAVVVFGDSDGSISS